MHLLLAYGSTSGDNLLYHDGKIPSAEKVDLRSTSEVAAGLDSKLFIQVLTFELNISVIQICKIFHANTNFDNFYFILGSWCTNVYRMDCISSYRNGHRKVNFVYLDHFYKT